MGRVAGRSAADETEEQERRQSADDQGVADDKGTGNERGKRRGIRHGCACHDSVPFDDGEAIACVCGSLHR